MYFYSPSSGTVISGPNLLEHHALAKLLRLVKDPGLLGVRKALVCFGDNLTIKDEVTEAAHWMELLGLARQVGLSPTAIEDYIKSHSKVDDQRGKLQKAKSSQPLQPPTDRINVNLSLPPKPETTTKPTLAAPSTRPQPTREAAPPVQTKFPTLNGNKTAIANAIKELRVKRANHQRMGTKLHQLFPSNFPTGSVDEVKAVLAQL
jgi:hypothetical protein